MKKWFFLLLIPAFVCGFLQSDPDVGTGSSTEGGAAYSGNVVIYHNANSLGTSYNLGSGTLSYTEGVSSVNGEWYFAQSDWDNAVCPLTSLSDLTDFRIGFYFTFENNVSTEVYTRFLRLPSDGSQFKMWVQESGSITFILGDNASYMLTSTDLDDESKHFVEIALNDTANTLYVYIDGVALGNLTYPSMNLSSLTDLYFGSGDTYAGWFYIDQLMISDDSTEDLFNVKDKTDF